SHGRVIQIPSIGVEIVVLVEPVSGAMELVGAGTAEEGDLPAGAAAEFGVGVGDADAKLFDAVDGQESVGAEATDRVVGYVDSVKREAALVIACAGDFAGWRRA